MKIVSRLTLISMILILSVSTISAQFGIKVGYNLSSMKYFSEDEFNEKFITGYQFGVLYKLGLGDKISFQPEAAYYTAGGKSDFFNVDEVERLYQFAKLNGLVNYNLIGNNDGIAVQLTGGFFAAYALSAKLNLDNQGADNIDFSKSDTYTRTNVGYIIGGGIRVNSFFVSIRSSIGVSELVNFSSQTSTANTSIKSRDFSLVAGYIF